jgi:hypothetical protein
MKSERVHIKMTPQLIANRANAQKSTGPRTPEGKAVAAQNARRLGLYVADTTLIQENPEEFAEIIAGYYADYAPNGGVEVELVKQLALATLKQHRYARIEGGLLSRELPQGVRHDIAKNIADAYLQNEPNWTGLLRAQAQAERSFYRAYNALEERKNRRIMYREPPEEIQIEANLGQEPIKPMRPLAVLTQPPLPVSAPAAPKSEPKLELKIEAKYKPRR